MDDYDPSMILMDWCDECESGEQVVDITDEEHSTLFETLVYRVLWLACGHSIAWRLTTREV